MRTSNIDLDANRPDDNAVEEFGDYVVDTYVGYDALFPPEIWSAAPDPDMHHLPRTSNNCESLHKHVKEKFGSFSPNITWFSTTIRLLHEKTYVKIQSTSASQQINTKDKAKHVFVAYSRMRSENIKKEAFLMQFTLQQFAKNIYQ